MKANKDYSNGIHAVLAWDTQCHDSPPYQDGNPSGIINDIIEEIQ